MRGFSSVLLSSAQSKLVAIDDHSLVSHNFGENLENKLKRRTNRTSLIGYEQSIKQKNATESVQTFRFRLKLREINFKNESVKSSLLLFAEE